MVSGFLGLPVRATKWFIDPPKGAGAAEREAAELLQENLFESQASRERGPSEIAAALTERPTSSSKAPRSGPLAQGACPTEGASTASVAPACLGDTAANLGHWSGLYRAYLERLR